MCFESEMLLDINFTEVNIFNLEQTKTPNSKL